MSNLAIHATTALRSVDLDTASDRAMWALDGAAMLDSIPPAPNWRTSLQFKAIIYHELGHVLGAKAANARNIAMGVRSDGTGFCICDKIENPVAAITFHLAGPIAEARYMPSAIHKYTDGKSYDFMAARLLIEEFNRQQSWPVLTCTAAAQTAVDCVQKHWKSIENLALVFADCGSLDELALRAFAGCGT